MCVSMRVCIYHTIQYHAVLCCAILCTGYIEHLTVALADDWKKRLEEVGRGDGPELEKTKIARGLIFTPATGCISNSLPFPLFENRL